MLNIKKLSTSIFPHISHVLLLSISFLIIAVVGCAYNYTNYVSGKRPYCRYLTADSFVVRVKLLDTTRNAEIESIIVNDLNEMKVRCISTKEYNTISDGKTRRSYMALKINQSPSVIERIPDIRIPAQIRREYNVTNIRNINSVTEYERYFRFNLFCTPTLSDHERDIWHAEFWMEPTKFKNHSLVKLILSNYIYEAIVKDSLWIEPKDSVL